MLRNSQLEAENKRLSQKVDEMKEICALTSKLNVKFKSQLEQESNHKENMNESNKKLKMSMNKLSWKCNELNQKVKILEINLKRKVMTRINQPKVQIIKTASDVVQMDNKLIEELQKRYDQLDVEHQEALNIIDELEFELDDVITLLLCYVSVSLSSIFLFNLHLRSIILKWISSGFIKKMQNYEKC